MGLAPWNVSSTNKTIRRGDENGQAGFDNSTLKVFMIQLPTKNDSRYRVVSEAINGQRRQNETAAR